jgi:hypothetical protein
VNRKESGREKYRAKNRGSNGKIMVYREGGRRRVYVLGGVSCVNGAGSKREPG